LHDHWTRSGGILPVNEFALVSSPIYGKRGKDSGHTFSVPDVKTQLGKPLVLRGSERERWGFSYFAIRSMEVTAQVIGARRRELETESLRKSLRGSAARPIASGRVALLIEDGSHHC
jgi:hypothetical protein